jgi:flagellar FliL protein
MVDKADTSSKAKRKGGGLVIKLALALGLMAAGGGAAFGAMSAGLFGSSAKAVEDNRPKLVRKGETDPYAPKPAAGDEAATADFHGDGGSEYRTAYFSFHDDFTTNLKESDHLLQVSLACSTRRDGRVLAWLKDHELAIRSALLDVIADTSQADVETLDGKQRLQRRMTAAINQVLVEHEGFGGIDAVYFRSLIVQ